MAMELEQKRNYCFHIFIHVSFKGVINKQAATCPQATTLYMSINHDKHLTDHHTEQLNTSKVLQVEHYEQAFNEERTPKKTTKNM